MQLPSLIVPLRHSPFLCAALLAAHLLPLLAVWLSHLSVFEAAGVTVLVAISAGIHLCRVRRRHGWRLLLHAAGHAQLQRTLAQPPVDVLLLTESRDLGWLIVLCWQPEGSGQVERFALCRDGMPAETWRKLRVSLRWRRLQAPI